MRTYIIIMAIMLAIWFNLSANTTKITYDKQYNPIANKIDIVERPYRNEICLNGSWEFMPIYQATRDDFEFPNRFVAQDVKIKIPSPWNVNNFTDGQGGDFRCYPSYPKAWESAQMGWMRKTVDIPAEWGKNQTILNFDAVMGKTKVFVNGKLACENYELFLPFNVDISDYIKAGQENEIVVGVSKASLFDEPGNYGRRTYVGGSMWGIEMVGIWQDVYLTSVASISISDLFVMPLVSDKTLKLEVCVTNSSSKSRTIDVDAEILKWYNTSGKTIHESAEERGYYDGSKAAVSFANKAKFTIPAKGTKKIVIEQPINGELNLWTPNIPNLYGAVVKLSENGTVTDKKAERFGWREFKTSGSDLLLNGEKIVLNGDSWHFTGIPQMTRRYALAWFSMLKDANCNAVRLHAQPFPEFYLDMADEMGICVLDETGIWSSDGGPKIDSEDYWNSCEEHLRRLIKRDKNHPSVFGWSVCNETIPVALHVFKAPEHLVEKQVQELNRWVRVTKECDPTRSWISGDGETDRQTDLTTVIGHYGDYKAMKHWASQNKPWGIGEQSMAYYGTPSQASAYNNDRAYESTLGRMEAIALESNNLIRTQAELNASYRSIFNLVWYGLQPMPLGKRDLTTSPSIEEGIHFTFSEGVYGVQPERLGPYSTTLNPGYDNELPLYKIWPLFDAVKNANLGLPYTLNCAENKDADGVRAKVDIVALCADDNARITNRLMQVGVLVDNNKKLTSKSIVIIDGADAGINSIYVKKISEAKKVGAKILIMGVSPENLELINSILPYNVVLEPRKATSFLNQYSHLMTKGLTHADFYFSELLKNGSSAMSYGLSGDFVAKSTIILKACGTEWQRWNYQPETSKTANVFRSELETDGSTVAIASLQENLNEYIVWSMDLSNIFVETQPLLAQMLKNIGIELSTNNLKDTKAIDGEANLVRALAHMYTYETIPQSISSSTINAQKESSMWQMVNLSDSNSTLAKPEHNKKSAAFVSFWIYSPRSLSNLLAEPDMPSLDLAIATNSNIDILLNDNNIYTKEFTQQESVVVPNIMLDKGWNHIIIKSVNSNENTPITLGMRFNSSNQAFMNQLLSSVIR